LFFGQPLRSLLLRTSSIRKFLLFPFTELFRKGAKLTALFTVQKDRFSERDTHAFNNRSSAQITAALKLSHFPRTVMSKTAQIFASVSLYRRLS
jgi:hypothetical protein